MKYYRFLFLAVVLIALFLCLYNLGSWAFMDFDEAYYARSFHEALVRNDFLTSTYLWRLWIDKPPLYVWLMKTASMIFGETEFSLRLPSALLTVLAVILVWKISEELTKKNLTAFLSSAILLTTGYFIFAGRQLRLDVPVTASILLAFYGFIKGLKNPKWFLLFAIGTSAGVMFKSVIGLFIVPLIFFYSIIYRNWKWIRNKFFWLSTLISFILIAPWYIYEAAKYGKHFWVNYFFTVGNRLSGEVSFGKDAPFFYHLKELFVVTNPWFFVFIISVVYFLINYFFLSSRATSLSSRIRLEGQRSPSDFSFLLLNLSMALFIIVFFHFPKNRVLYYFIPALPFMAMFIAGLFGTLFEKHRRVFIFVAVPLFLIGSLHTILKIYSSSDRNLYLQKISKVSRYEVANEEKIVAKYILQNSDLPTYLYQWQFYPTLMYYTNYTKGKPQLFRAGDKTKITSPSLILLPKLLYPTLESVKRILPDEALVELLYSGNVALLVRISIPSGN